MTKLVTQEMMNHFPDRYRGRIALVVPYPELPRQKCALCIGQSGVWDWAIEIKMLRFLGDNGKLNDNLLMHILSPYPEHRSALTDCMKLSSTALGKAKAILIYGFDHIDWPLEPAIEAFETLAKAKITLSDRYTAHFEELVHPIHNCGKVFGWQVNS